MASTQTAHHIQPPIRKQDIVELGNYRLANFLTQSFVTKSVKIRRCNVCLSVHVSFRGNAGGRRFEDLGSKIHIIPGGSSKRQKQQRSGDYTHSINVRLN